MRLPLWVPASLFLFWAILPWPFARWAAAFVGLFAILAWVWSALLSRGLASGHPEPVLRTFSGRRLEVVTKLENRSPLPSGLLFVHDSAGGLETWGETRRHLALGPFARFRATFVVRGRERGERTLGPLRVSGADPAGLFPFVRLASPRSLIVYPPVHQAEGWPVGGLPPGPRKWDLAPVDDVSRFRSYRDFQPGDPLARLSAAAWARRGTPQVRTFDFTVARPSGVVVDLRATGYPLRLRWALIEDAVETAATLVWELLGRGESVWLTVLDVGGEGRPQTLGPARGWAQARPFLERLALAVPDKTSAPGTPGVVLPPAPLRLLWVAPASQPRPELPVHGYELIVFPIEEGRHRGVVQHP